MADPQDHGRGGGGALSRWQVSLLHRFALSRAGSEVALPRSSQRLVAWLALHPPAPREQVAGALHPDDDEQHALATLRTAVWRLQRSAPGLVLLAPGLVGLHPGADLDVSCVAEQARLLLAAPQDGAEPLLVAQRWEGELLPGWYDDWLLDERERLRQLQLHALEVAARELCRRGRFGEALDAACAVVQLEPLRESGRVLLIQVHLAEGNLNEALRAGAVFRELLVRELGVAPSQRLQALLGPALTAPAPPGRDLRPGRAVTSP